MNEKPARTIRMLPAGRGKKARTPIKTAAASNVTVIPAKPEYTKKVVERQLRVAAYCRVSTDDEEQRTSYEAQKAYYTDKIMTTPNWTMVDIFADEGLSGTSTKKRKEFNRMIRLCKQRKIDLILTKSISRFARNTVDCLQSVRLLRENGIGVIFEKENINTLESDCEMMITLHGAFAQAESESISENVRWGIQRAMSTGHVQINYTSLYAYQRGEDGNPQIVPEEAKIVRWVGSLYLAGDSVKTIRKKLEDAHIPNALGEPTWGHAAVQSLLFNEFYVGDVLRQKTFITDCISKKAVRNTGQLPMYLTKDHHEGVYDRDTYNAIQEERARRISGKSPSKYAPTGKSTYSSKYALTERLVCGECGTLYRRVTWTRPTGLKIVWRCVSRLEYGKKYCHSSPSIEEEPLQKTIMAAINSVMASKVLMISDITDAMQKELLPIPGEDSLADVERQIENLEIQFRRLLMGASNTDDQESYTEKHSEQFQQIVTQMAVLKEKRQMLETAYAEDEATLRRIKRSRELLEASSPYMEEWNEGTIRQLVEMVKVISKDQLLVVLKDGTEIHQSMMQ